LPSNTPADIAPIAEPAVPPSQADAKTDWLPFAAVALAPLIALIAAALWFVRRRRNQTLALPAPTRAAIVPVVPKAPAPQPRPATPQPIAPLPPRPAPEPLRAQPAPPASTAAELALSLEATRLSATLVAATLAYRLMVTNSGADPLNDIAIAGDLTSAHASRPVEEQFGLIGPELPPLHRIATLAPGETVILGGEMRLPLSAILPIRQQQAQLFVPLARFDAWASGAHGRAVHARAIFLVGQEGDDSARLQPFRLDLGPRVWARVAQKPLLLPTV